MQNRVLLNFFQWKHFLALVLIMCACRLTVFGQSTKRITGKVVDEKNEVLPGVNVQVKGTTTGSSTDSQGNYSVTLTGNESGLVFSFIGYKSKEIAVGNASVYNVTLEVDVAVLHEVLVVGYGTQSRETVTTSISKLDTKVLANVAFANAASALQGTISGVRVQSINGQPGAAPRVIVRGGTSINNPNGAEPLYIIDGIIRPDMANINSQEIESMQVLKDAASTSIYGARGSNGVVIITTKSGKAGKTRVSYNYKIFSSEVGKTYDLVSARDFIKFYRLGVMANARKIPERVSLLTTATPGGTGNDLTNNTAFTTQYLSAANEHKLKEGWESMPDPLDPSKTIIFQDTDFQSMLYRTGISHDHNLSLSGGTEKANFNMGLGYLKNQGIAIGTDYQRISVNLNSELKVKDNLSVFGRLIYSKSFQNGGAWPYARTQALAPTIKYKFEDGTLAPGNSGDIPEYQLSKKDLKSYTDNLTISVGANWDILPGLTFSPQLSMFAIDADNRSFQKAYFSGPTNYISTRAASGAYSKRIQYQADAVLSYGKTFLNHHNFDAKAGFSYYERNTRALSASGQGASSDLIPTLNASVTPVSVSSSESSQILVGYFGRVNYDYDQKYLLSINARYDGASNLGANHQWGIFPGISVGWNVHKEGFWTKMLPQGAMQLKVRSSYGVNGNISGLSDFQSQGQYSVGARYGGNAAITNSLLANSDLRWERSKTFDVGADIGFFNNRINLLFDYYRRVTDNLLTDYTLPYSTGFTSIRTNLGSLENRGLEFEVNAQVLPATSALSWNVSFNASKVKNKILALPANGVENNRIGGFYLYDPARGDYAWLGGLQEGSAMGDAFAYKQIGIYSTDEEAAKAPVDMIITTPDKTKYGGDVNWQDVDNNGVIDSKDRVYVGNIYPTWTGGFTNSLGYKNFNFTVRMDYTTGHIKYNWSRALILAQYGTLSGITTDVLRSWQKQGDVTDIPRYYWADQQVQRNIARGQATIDSGNSEFYEPGDFLAVRELTLSYSFPGKILQKLKISDLRLNLTANNLHYFTKFKGLNPEDGGQDNGGYPMPKNFIIGAQLTF